MQTLFFFFLVSLLIQNSITADDSILNLLYHHPKIKILHKKKTIPKKTSPNTYISKTNSYDSRFLNSQEKIKGVDIVKKTIQITGGSSLEFKISLPLNHHLIFNLHNQKTKEVKDGIKFFLNNNPVYTELKSTAPVNHLRIESNEDILLENIHLLPIEANHNKPDILFIVIDSLRADVCGFNGANFNATPFLDKLAKSSSVFKQHLVNASWTRPSTLAFLTSLYPSKSFINLWDYTVFPEEKASFYRAKIPTLPSTLSTNGYKSIMIGNNPFLTDHRAIGVDVGFEEVIDYSYYENDTIPITENIIAHIKSLPPKEKRRPEFIFLNYNDPHKPYNPPTKYKSQIKNADQFDPRKKDYLGEVAFVDSELEKVFATLKDKNFLDNTLVLITSDHGEVMNPAHGKSKFTGVYTLFGHGQGLYEEDIHTPLLIKFPHQKDHKTVTTVSRSIDLMPTILQEIGYSLPSNIDGLSLQPILEGKEKEERLYYGESRGVIGIRKDGWKWMQKVFFFHRPGAHWDGQVNQEPMYLYNYKKDPEEITPIADESKKNEFKNLANLFLKKTSIYGIRISNPKGSDSKLIDLSIETNVGKVLLTDDKGNSSHSENFQITQKGIRLSKNFTESESLEFYCIPYPDISFPKFTIAINGNQITKGELGVGEKDIFPGKCHNRAECSEMYLIKHKKPDIPNKFRVQIWLETKSIQVTNEKIKLENDAIDILKKQGYIK
ncbi:MAG TPA: sulfatase [Leptospiraceae bacterium]|nr:sulfatase [Leptospiraceae bacterium]HMW04467.1 sulfatase [Leptospiraceae bacterium]HMX31125.1 sulfatase [Leptospiraceae bacterium]HMY30653.1 sulfatase [Leptospiraceae bacterium]HMZ65814.1 sulfatase [Leptospiraceae bacterium]